MERERIVVGAFANAGRAVAEVSHLTGPARERLLAGVRGEGHEHYWSAREMSPTGGVLVLSAHFGSWELCGAALAAQGWSISAVQRERGNSHLARLVTSWRSGPPGAQGM